MDGNLVLTYVLKIVGSVGASIIITLATSLYTKFSKKIKETRITNFIGQTVQAAEQLFPNEGKKMGPEKYAYVVETVIAKFPTLSNDEYLKALIEGEVYAVSQQTKQIAEQVNNTTTVENSIHTA